MGVSTIRKIIYETCDAIWEELGGIYVSPPNETEWKLLAVGFRNKTGMPNCIGAIDGKHINMVCPRKSGSVYFNYRRRFSTVLLAVCDSNYSFTLIDVGACGSQSDGGIFRRSGFGKQILQGTFPFPEAEPLTNRMAEPFPFYFVGDAAFPLRKNLMRPYPGRNLDSIKTNFNKNLSRARVRIENSFGVLANRWRVLINNIHCSPKNVNKIILATIVLHNYLIFTKDITYTPPDFVDREVDGVTIPGQWRRDATLTSSRITTANRASQEAFAVRNQLARILNENL